MRRSRISLRIDGLEETRSFYNRKLKDKELEEKQRNKFYKALKIIEKIIKQKEDSRKGEVIMKKKEEVEKKEIQFKKYRICFDIKVPKNKTGKLEKSIEEQMYKMYEENGVIVSYAKGSI